MGEFRRKKNRLLDNHYLISILLRLSDIIIITKIKKYSDTVKRNLLVYCMGQTDQLFSSFKVYELDYIIIVHV